MEIGKKIFDLRNPYIIFCMKTSIYSPDSNKCEFSSVGQFSENLGQHLIVIVFREIQDFNY